MPRTKKNDTPATTAQALGGIIGSCRKIMRKDKGLSTDLDRLPMLTWILFLKFLDDLEQVREAEAAMEGKRYRTSIEAPYRWRDWAAKSDGITGDSLIAFISQQDEAPLPNGKKGPGLFAYLRSLTGSNGGDRRDVIRAVFQGTVNRMLNGYLLRDVLNKVNCIHFTSTDEIYTLGHLYETMLKEMRDAAGENGEFYSPRALVKFIVSVVNPRLGESVLDPAAGTGGFLAEAFEHLKKQCRTANDHHRLQQETLFGIEAKPLPFLLCQMNLLLHGIETPDIDPLNALRFPLREIGDKDRVDVIITNPPFGGEEERGILGNFPEDKKTAETTLLFLQLIMRKLRRQPKHGRAAVVVPNGTLYATGIAARIRRELLEEFNLHTVVRLPKGVFEPYADIPTNVLFFDRSGPTVSTWFYQHPLPAHRAEIQSPSYTRSAPLMFDEFLPVLDWWGQRVENNHCWEVGAELIAKEDYNLDRKNPRSIDETIPDMRLAVSRIQKYAGEIRQCIDGMGETLELLKSAIDQTKRVALTKARLGDVAEITKGSFPTQKTSPGPYKFVVTAAERKTATGFQFDCPAVCIPMVSSTGHGHAAIHRIHFEEGKFALANIMAGVVVREGQLILPKYLFYYLWRYKDEKLVTLMSGTANTSLTVGKLSDVSIEFPSLEIQKELVRNLDDLMGEVNALGLLLEAGKKLAAGTSRAALMNTFASEGKSPTSHS